MWGENSEREEKDSSSIITEWQNLKLFATSANSYLQSNQGLFCLWQYSTVTKKAADGKSGLKLPDLKRCRDTRHRALVGKAGIRGWSKVGHANRFKITFRARGWGLYTMLLKTALQCMQVVHLGCCIRCAESGLDVVHVVPRVVICLDQGEAGRCYCF